MQDAFGVELVHDQEVVFITGYDNTRWFLKGTVAGFTEKKVRIREDGSGGDIRPTLRTPNLVVVRNP